MLYCLKAPLYWYIFSVGQNLDALSAPWKQYRFESIAIKARRVCKINQILNFHVLRLSHHVSASTRCPAAGTPLIQFSTDLCLPRWEFMPLFVDTQYVYLWLFSVKACLEPILLSKWVEEKCNQVSAMFLMGAKYGKKQFVQLLICCVFIQLGHLLHVHPNIEVSRDCAKPRPCCLGLSG